MKAGSKKTKKVLVVDVGGTHVKALATGHLQERKIASGLKMTASKMAEDVKRLTKDWEYDVVREEMTPQFSPDIRLRPGS
jgi:hypothetical protein